MPQTNRRSFLRTTGLVGASAAVLGVSSTAIVNRALPIDQFMVNP
jgi:hypothetical protein